MALFSKKDTAPLAATRANGEVISSIISKDMQVIGELNFKGKARIDGTVEGNVKGEHLVLSESGRIKGDLDLISLVCHGSIIGNVKAQQVTTHSTASLHGNLKAASLSVEPGANLNGEITASTQQKPMPPPPPATPKPSPEKKEAEKN